MQSGLLCIANHAQYSAGWISAAYKTQDDKGGDSDVEPRHPSLHRRQRSNPPSPRPRPRSHHDKTPPHPYLLTMGRDRRSSSIASTRSRNSSFQLPSHAIDFLNGRGRESNLDDDSEDSPQRQRGTCSRPPRASCNKGNGLTRSRSSSIANRDRSPSFAPRAHRGTLTSPNTTPTKRMKDGASRPSFKKKESGSGFRTTHRGAM